MLPFSLAAAQPGMDALPAKRMRLRGKTSVRATWAYAVVAASSIVSAVMGAPALPNEYLEGAGPSEEDTTGRRRVYLVTLPHPRVSGHGGL